MPDLERERLAEINRMLRIGERAGVFLAVQTVQDRISMWDRALKVDADVPGAPAKIAARRMESMAVVAALEQLLKEMIDRAAKDDEGDGATGRKTTD